MHAATSTLSFTTDLKERQIAPAHGVRAAQGQHRDSPGPDELADLIRQRRPLLGNGEGYRQNRVAGKLKIFSKCFPGLRGRSPLPSSVECSAALALSDSIGRKKPCPLLGQALLPPRR